MELDDFFAEHRRVAIGLSGGVDSTFLLHEAVRCGADVRAYFVSSPFQPQFELDDAARAAREIGAPLRVLCVDTLDDPTIAANTAERCYHCKRRIFSAIAEAARGDGYDLLLDGNNASDDEGDRPGMRAASELAVRSPLRECGLTKDEIRRRSRDAGLFTWDKPAYACLATRVPTGTTITREQLAHVDSAESELRALGFVDLRVRVWHGAARLQLRDCDIERAASHRDEIRRILLAHFDAALLDLECRG